MAKLKVLLQKNKLDLLKKQRSNLDPQFEDLRKREEKLAAAIDEVNEETTEEEREIVESKVDELEAEKAQLEEQKTQLEEQIKAIEEEIAQLEEEDEIVEESVNEEEEEENRSSNKQYKKRGGVNMNNLEKREQIKQLIQREDVKKFLAGARNLMQGRAIEGGKLTIPTTVLDIIRTEIDNYSKLIKYVDKREVKGLARELIIGEYPEAIWIETCTNLNELKLTIYDVEVDGYTVGGYIPVCRAAILDSDLDLVNEIVTALGQAIGLAVDKAIVYGTGKKMPLGIVTRLAQTTKPENWRVTNQAWENLSTTNIKQVTGTGATLYKNILKVVKLKKNSKGGEKIWIMSENTKNILITEALSFNAAGAIVTGLNDTFPIAGGTIVELDFIPDGDIITGYGKQYLLAEREGVLIEHSDDVQFYNHKRVYKGLARYDGTPVNGAGFALFNIDNVAPTTSVTFPEDLANAEAPAPVEGQ